MKYLFALLMLAWISTNDEWQPQTKTEMLTVHMKCMEHSNVSDLMLSASDFWNISDESWVASIRRYVYCLLSGLGYFNHKTGFDIDRIMQQIKEMPYLQNSAFQRSVIEKCADKNVNSDPADVWAFRGFRCLMDEIMHEQMESPEKMVLV